MFTSGFLILSLLGRTLSAPTLLSRDNPSDTDLLLSCPGAAGSPNIKRADKCTLVNIVNNPDTTLQYNVGNVQGKWNKSVMLTIGGQTTTSTTTTASANVGINFEGINIGGGLSSGDTKSSTQSNSTMITIAPGRQSVMTMGVLAHSQSGNVQVNFGSRVDDHFIFMCPFSGSPGAVITQTVPTDQITFDVHETAADHSIGTNALDLNNHS
ncbi:hypothetical protein R3P38DRAFT_3023846 [Favolaschia claudopus]|uniref:Uncharacterized protein n=1 Tax=Favolaschia claudopus TaxID=2862362 RepID=A0AAW0AH00_9AGAR